MLYYESFPVIGDFCPKPFGKLRVIPVVDNNLNDLKNREM